MSGHDDILKLLISKGADINRIAESGMTPFLGSCLKGKLSTVKIFLESNIDPHSMVDRDFNNVPLKGANCLFLAVMSGDLDLIEFLLEKGFKPEEAITSKGQLAIEIAKNKNRTDIVKLLEPRKQQSISKLLSLTRTPISKRLSSEYFVVSPTETPRDIIMKIRKTTNEFSSLDYIYVINQKKQLIGACNMHELLTQQEDTPIYKFMSQSLIEAHLKSPLEMVVYKIVKYRLHALPIVDSNKELIGIIPFDNISDIIEAKFNS